MLEPIAASRHRTSKYGSNYYDDPYNSFRRNCKAALSVAMEGKERITGPVVAYIHFIKERPGKPSYEYPTLGDGDNLEKALYDALNDLAWDDDRHCIGAEWAKSWAAPGEPGEFRIEIHQVDPIEENAAWLQWWIDTANQDEESE